MKIALVIPTYKQHYIYLNRLCSNIAEQTRLPDLVIIRASSCDEGGKRILEEVLGAKWPYPLQILDSPEKQYQAQNRNEGADAVPPEFDIISFFDSDDLMHPRRLEFIETVFEQGAEAVFHDCSHGRQSFTQPVWDTYDSVNAVHDSILLQKESAIQQGTKIISLSEYATILPNIKLLGKEVVFYRPIPMDEDLETQLSVHFGHASVLTRVFKLIRFDEAALGYEDAKFVSDIVFQHYKTAHIREKLSVYLCGSLSLCL